MTQPFIYQVPELETERLRLRAFHPDDFERYAEMMADADEGAAAALEYAQTALGRTEIASLIRRANQASIRVATSLGAVAGESVEFFGAPSVVYRYPNSPVRR